MRLSWLRQLHSPIFTSFVSPLLSHLLPFMFFHPIILQSCTFHPRLYAHHLQGLRTDCSDGHQHQAPAGSSGQGIGSCVFPGECPPGCLVISCRNSVGQNVCAVRCSPLCDGAHCDNSTSVSPESISSKVCVPFSVAA